MTLHVVIPPHPLIGHWLSILRIETTPPAIYATAIEQLGKWLTYEALRDWLPNKTEKISTSNGVTDGVIIESSVPLLIIPSLPGGLLMWQGAKEILPNASLCFGGVPDEIENNAGIIIYCDQINSGKLLLQKLIKLKELNVESRRIRIITPLASSDGLKVIGESFSDLKIYSSCIDSTVNENGEIIPGIGIPSLRLNTRITSAH